MNHIRIAIALVAAASLAGCATDGPATSGAAVRAAMASQVIAPQAQRQAAGMDGAAAIESYKNYVESYDSPKPQLNDSAFRQ